MSHFQKNVDKIVKEMLLSNNTNNNTDNNNSKQDQHISSVLKKNALQTQIDSLVSKAKNKN